MRRIGTVAALSLTPVVALAWAGCSSDDKTPNASFTNVDPGGTWGAEVTVTIKGPGRVTSATPGIDCPANCFTKYIFPNNAADGATGGLGLTAHVTPGSRFTGWTFDPAPTGSRGRGATNCNPVSRPGAQPPVDPSAVDITLPYGETAGTAPAGQEGACAGQTTVPLAYNVTANFETPPPPPDAAGDANDGGDNDVLYIAASGSNGAYDVGYRNDGYLFWRYITSSGYGIGYGTNPTGSLSQTPGSIPLGSSPSAFVVNPYGAAYQSSGTVYVIAYNNGTSPVALSNSPGTCYALAVESSSSFPHVYCRTSSQIFRWTSSGGSSYASTPTLLYTSLNFGSDLVVDGTGSSAMLYYSDSSNIYSVPTTGGPDAGPTTPFISSAFTYSGVATLGTFGPGLAWLSSSGNVYATPSRSSSGRTDTNVPATTSNRWFARDIMNGSYFWVANNSSIYHAFYAGSAGTQPFRTGLSGIQGVASDSTYVYTAHSDGTIRRISRSGF